MDATTTMIIAMEMETTAKVDTIIAPSAPMVTPLSLMDCQVVPTVATVATVMVMVMDAVLTATMDMETTVVLHTMAAMVAMVATVVADMVDMVATVATLHAMVATVTVAAGDLDRHRLTTFT